MMFQRTGNGWLVIFIMSAVGMCASLVGVVWLVMFLISHIQIV